MKGRIIKLLNQNVLLMSLLKTFNAPPTELEKYVTRKVINTLVNNYYFHLRV
jgi:hypothetical protein